MICLVTVVALLVISFLSGIGRVTNVFFVVACYISNFCISCSTATTFGALPRSSQISKLVDTSFSNDYACYCKCTSYIFASLVVPPTQQGHVAHLYFESSAVDLCVGVVACRMLVKSTTASLVAHFLVPRLPT